MRVRSPWRRTSRARFASLERQRDIGELKIKISGCINACGHHHVGHIGILGVEKKGAELYQITLGGSGDEHTSIGEIVGRGFGPDEITDAIETIVETYLGLQLRPRRESSSTPIRRVGAAPFKEALYGAECQGMLDAAARRGSPAIGAPGRCGARRLELFLSPLRQIVGAGGDPAALKGFCRRHRRWCRLRRRIRRCCCT